MNANPSTHGSAHVFEIGARTLQGPADRLIGQFDFLNASARPAAERVRAEVDRMFARYPASGRDALRDRLRSRDDIKHQSAFFELVIHELILRSGSRVLEIEPKIQGTRRSPDFLAEDPHGRTFYAEAKIATGQSREVAAAEARWRPAIRAVDEVQSSDFFLSMRRTGTPTAPIRVRVLRRQIENWLKTLNYQTVAESWDTGNDLAEFVYAENGASIHLAPIPRQAARGSSVRTRAIAAGVEFWTGEATGPIRDAVVSKASRYGDLGAPYIVAVNAMYEEAEEDIAEDAVNAAWRTTSGPVNTRVSAVLSTERLTPWSLGCCAARLFENPWARYPLAGISLAVDRLAVQDGKPARSDGRSLHEILELPADWPG